MRDDPSPLNPLPPFALVLFLVIIGVEATFSLGARGLVGGPGAVGWRAGAIEDYGFHTEILRWMIETGQYPVEHVRRLVTYAFVHGSFTHALFAGVLLLALGKFLSGTFRHWAVLVLFAISTVAGAVAYAALPGQQPWLIGAFPGVYGLIGGFTYVMWLRLGQLGANQARAFTLIGVLMGLQLVFALLFGAAPTWVADVTGFAAGFVASVPLIPGGWARLVARLRHE
ncbi:rhomboid family intramembrane serine protease [Roseovarius autotrophicus]|uniref:rhomboid family intramembrane serine protease n=1 Tax=Roseovarius autotrophicus TaxID=2824121 RepID=UPI0019DF12EE|nr:rhomboid family intramembrane serine protease [Roseovarius autotrophicus]MBE0452414.1 rhomboid family intramembrane serine protease [Roseovarius sp.]